MLSKNPKVQVLDSRARVPAATINGDDQHCEHHVGHLVYRVYFCGNGVSVQIEDDREIPNFEYQMLLSPHGSGCHEQCVDITCKQTDK